MHRSENLLVQSNHRLATGPNYLVHIPGTTHFNFFDFTIMSPLYVRLGVLGELDGYRMVDITSQQALDFFDVHLKGRDKDLLDETGDSDYSISRL